jgi:hypothetical protein
MTTPAQARKIAAAAARKYGLDVNIFLRQMNAEAAFQDHPANGAGAAGWAQFIPATAQSMGVKNVHDPHEAYDGAARLMAKLVKAHGSYENALRAYNAGPGAIQASHGYSETNNYVAKILSNGRDPKKLSKPGTSAASGGATRTTTTTSPTSTTIKTPGSTRLVSEPVTTFDQAGYDKQAKLATLKSVLSGFQKNPNAKPSLLSSVLPDTADPAAFTKTVNETKAINTPGSTITVNGSKAKTTTASGGGSTASPSGKALPGLNGTGSKLLELIYNGQNKGYAAKNGQAVDGPSFYSQVWAGHANHVHVAAGKKTTVALGKLAQQMGLHVGENPHFGGVDPVHAPNSYHYKGEAIDVSGDPKTMARYAALVERLKGIKQ